MKSNNFSNWENGVLTVMTTSALCFIVSSLLESNEGMYAYLTMAGMVLLVGAAAVAGGVCLTLKAKERFCFAYLFLLLINVFAVANL